MADIIGIASGCIALATFAIQSCTALSHAISSFKSHSQRVGDICSELQALSGVLKSLATTIDAVPDFDFSALNFPLLRCGNACKEFLKELERCSSHSKDRTSFRDWAKLRYMGEDIDGFRRLISSYKMTISIALTDATLRKTAVTAENVHVYNDLLLTTRTDLEEQLQRINDKLDLIGDTLVVSQADAEEVKAIQEERTSTEKCLQICAQLSEHIDQIQLVGLQDTTAAKQTNGSSSSQQITNDGLQDCKQHLASAIKKLEDHNSALFNRLLHRTNTAATTAEERSDLTRLREEWEMNRQSMEICSKAYENLKDNVSNINNYAVGDAVQFLVSTSEKTIHGTNRGLGWRTRQVGGDIDPESFRQMMRSLEVMDLPVRISDRSDKMGEAAHEHSEVGRQDQQFQNKYGKGFNLASGPSDIYAGKLK